MASKMREMGPALVGPLAFGGAAVVSSRRVPGYSHRDEPVSALAAKTEASMPIMVGGFVALGCSELLLAAALQGARTAPAPVPALVGVTGAATVAAGLARNSDRSCPSRFFGHPDVTLSDDVHAAASVFTFVLWGITPLVAAARARDAGAAYRVTSGALGLACLGAMSTLTRRARAGKGDGGTLQRAAIAAGLAWYPLAARRAR